MCGTTFRVPLTIDSDGDGIGDAYDPTPGNTPACTAGVGVLKANSQSALAFAATFNAHTAGPIGVLGFADKATGAYITSSTPLRVSSYLDLT